MLAISVRPSLKTTIGAAIVCAALAGFWIYASTRGTVVSITNDSGGSLRNVSLVGSGFAEHFDTISSQSTVSRSVHVRGESSLEVKFTVGNVVVQKIDVAYLEDSWGYKAHVTIGKDLSVTCNSGFGAY
jgi:hypothetical protein